MNEFCKTCPAQRGEFCKLPPLPEQVIAGTRFLGVAALRSFMMFGAMLSGRNPYNVDFGTALMFRQRESRQTAIDLCIDVQKVISHAKSGLFSDL